MARRMLRARKALLSLLVATCVWPIMGKVHLPSFITRPCGAAVRPQVAACGFGTPCSDGDNGARGQEKDLFQRMLAGARWKAKANVIQLPFRATGSSRLQVFSVDGDGTLANLDARVNSDARVVAHAGDGADHVRGVQVRQTQSLSPPP